MKIGETMSDIETGQRLKSLRKNAGKTQADIAEMLEVSRSNYAYYESGKSKPPINKIQILADYYSTTADYILTGINTKAPSIDIGERLKEIENLAKSNYVDINFKGRTVTPEMRSVLIQTIQNTESILQMLSARGE